MRIAQLWFSRDVIRTPNAKLDSPSHATSCLMYKLVGSMYAITLRSTTCNWQKLPATLNFMYCTQFLILHAVPASIAIGVSHVNVEPD